MEIEIDELFGLPAHPLLVHIPVVVIPLAMLLALVALWPRVRRGAAWAAAVLALVGGVGAVLAIGAGESLQDDVRETEMAEEHAEQGDQVELPAIAFAVLAVAGAAAVEVVRRRGPDDEIGPEPAAAPRRSAVSSGPGAVAVTVDERPAPSDGPPRRTVVATVLLVLSVVAGGFATYTVVQAGHSGAKAVWDETPGGTDGDRGPVADDDDGGSSQDDD